MSATSGTQSKTTDSRKQKTGGITTMKGKIWLNLVLLVALLTLSGVQPTNAPVVARELVEEDCLEAYGQLSHLLTTTVSAIERVSVASDGTQGDYTSYWPVISANGRHMAFLSGATNLVPGDTNNEFDVFAYDRQTRQTTRVSVASDGTEGNGDSESGAAYPAISADGRYVVFRSSATNLVANDTNNAADIFLHDRDTGQTVRVSIASSGIEGNSVSSYPAISADGRYVGFISWANNLVLGDTNGIADVFIHDRWTGQIERVSIASDGTQANSSNGAYWRPAISVDGHFVAFYSFASNLVPGDTNFYGDIFVRDRLLGQTKLVSVASDGTQADQGGYGPVAISEDGRFITFRSPATNLVPGDTNGWGDIFIHDQQTGQTERVSISSDGTEANSWSEDSSISADGRFVVFDSHATNLVIGDASIAKGVFIHDRQTRETVRVSGSQADGNSEMPGISSNGQYVVFESGASNLVASDTNGYSDIFVAELVIEGPFLDLPLSYFNFSQSAQGNKGSGRQGRVNSWLDHTNPDYTKNQNLTRWDGEVFDFTISPPLIGQSWYDGHSGLDFSQSYPGEPVFAAAAGTIDDANTGWGCLGWHVTIDHGNGYKTIYGHLRDEPTVTGHVNAGDPIGIIGNTFESPCFSEGAHLHFEVQFNGTTVDPYGWDKVGAGTPDPWSPGSVYLWKYPLQDQKGVDSGGGMLTSPAGNKQATIPAGALTSLVTVELWDAPVANPSASLHSTGHSFWLRVLEWLSGSSLSAGSEITAMDFTLPVTLTVTYGVTETRHLDLSQLTIYQWSPSSGEWLPLSSTVDPGQQKVTAETTETGEFDVQAPLLCPNDTTEPDDSFYFATAITSPIPLTRFFDVQQDEDWFRFTAVVSNSYQISTTNLAAGVDTILELYAPDGLTLLASDDNSGGGNASKIEWQAPLSGTYFLRVLPASGSAIGCDASYNLVVSKKVQGGVYLPIIMKNH